jgi:hypothetical protein
MQHIPLILQLTTEMRQSSIEHGEELRRHVSVHALCKRPELGVIACEQVEPLQRHNFELERPPMSVQVPRKVHEDTDRGEFRGTGG